MENKSQLNSANNQAPHQKSLSLLTYNVWRDNSSNNQDRLVAFIAEKGADAVCLQEVNRKFYGKLEQNSTIKSLYDFVYPNEFVNNCYDGDLLLVKKQCKPTLYQHVRLQSSAQSRYMSCGFFTVNGVKIVVGTAHLESEFFENWTTEVKARQISEIYAVLDRVRKEKSADCILFAGDCNFTGTDGGQLEGENAAVEKVNLVDVWKFFNDTTDKTHDENFRERDATWDGKRNPNVKHKEFHRPDRVFMRLFSHKVTPKSMQRVVSDMSDHYGLTAEFNVN